MHLFLFSILLLLCGPLLAGDTDKLVRFELIESASAPVPPFYWYDYCEDAPRGSVPHLREKILGDLGYQLQAAASNFIESDQGDYGLQRQRRYQRLLAGEFDLLLAPRDHPPGVLLGRQAILSLNMVAVYRRGLEPVAQLADLKHYRGTTRLNPSSELYRSLSSQLPGLERQLTPLPDAFKDLANGELDYLIGDRYLVSISIRRHELKDHLAVLDLGVEQEGLFFAVAEGGAMVEMLAEIDDQLVSYKESGYIDHLNSKYMALWLKARGCAAPAVDPAATPPASMVVSPSDP